MHVVDRVCAAFWQLEPRAATMVETTSAAGATVVPLRPAPPPLVLVQRWIFAPVASMRAPTAASPRPAPHRPAPHLHPVR